MNTPMSTQVKHTTRPQLRREWLEQAKRDARKEGKPWLLVICERGKHNSIACLDFDYLCAMLRVLPEGVHVVSKRQEVLHDTVQEHGGVEETEEEKTS